MIDAFQSYHDYVLCRYNICKIIKYKRIELKEKKSITTGRVAAYTGRIIVSTPDKERDLLFSYTWVRPFTTYIKCILIFVYAVVLIQTFRLALSLNATT